MLGGSAWRSGAHRHVFQVPLKQLRAARAVGNQKVEALAHASAVALRHHIRQAVRLRLVGAAYNAARAIMLRSVLVLVVLAQRHGAQGAHLMGASGRTGARGSAENG